MTKTKIYYFAYGSNLSLKQMKKRCPHAKFVAKSKINNHRVSITGYSSRWRGGGATIIKEKGAEVWGVVYELDKDCLLRLDGFEGLRYRSYARKKLKCHFLNGKTRLVTTYIREPKRISHPSKLYRNTIINGAKYYELPTSYIRELDSYLR